jgi:hypothetical protein
MAGIVKSSFKLHIHFKMAFCWFTSDVNNKKEFKIEFLKNFSENVGSIEPTSTQKICDLAVVVDHSFFSEIGQGSISNTILQVLWILKGKKFFVLIEPEMLD